MRKYLLLNDEGFAGFTCVDFPAEVEGKVVKFPDGKYRLIVPETELARIGAEAYQPDEFYQPNENHGLPFDNYEVVHEN